MKAAAIALLLALALLAAPGVAGAEPEGWAYKLAGELMSPFCPGRTLADCPSDAAKSLVMWVIVQEAAGRSRADVEEELFARYGEVLRPTPKAEGFGLTAYVIPVFAFAAGGLLIGVFLYRQTRRAAEPVARPVVDPELERIVDEELAG